MKKHYKIFILLSALFFFCALINHGALSIYREKQDDSIDLSILNPTSGYTVTFDTQGGESVEPIQREANEPIGTLPTTTKLNHNFLGWYTEIDGGTKITASTLVTDNVVYHAHWEKIVCKKATTLHTEICSQDGGCLSAGYSLNDTISYGAIPGANSPLPGDAYDCDVNDDGTYDAATERFYYIRNISENDVDSAALVHFTSFDELGQADSSSERLIYLYDDGKTHLPDSVLWSNPALTTFDGKVSRYINQEDLVMACGTFSTADNYLNSCQYFLETSRFQSGSLGRSGIWVEKVGSRFYRVDTRTSKVANVESDSKNTVRPVIQIPAASIDGYKEKVAYTISFNSQGGSAVEDIVRYENQAIGNLPIPTKENNFFDGWYTNTEYTQKISENTIVTGDAIYYAKWIEDDVSLPYVYRIPGECKFTTSGIVNGDNGECISTINPTAQDIDYTVNALSTKRYIDTGISLYDTTNHDYDYEIGFTLIDYSNSGQVNDATIMNTKAEDSEAHYPGVVFRKKSNTADFMIQSRESTAANAEYVMSSSGVSSVKIYRLDSEIYYSVNGAPKTKLNDLTAYNPIFDTTVWFGAAPSDASATTARRYFKGTISDMYIKLKSTEKVTITFNPNDPTLDSTTKTISKGSAIGQLPEISKSGYTFLGWFTEDTGGAEITENTTVSADTTYYAHWAENATITLNPMGGTVSPNTITMIVGSEVGELPTPEKTGYTFLGWFTEETGGTEITEDTIIDANDTYYAHWAENVTITLNPVGGTVSPNTITMIVGSEVGELPTPEYEGYVFDGWYEDDEYETLVTSSTVVSSNTEFFAKWRSALYIAEVNGVQFETLDEAINAVPTGSVKTTVTILKDIEITSTITIPSNKWVEFDIGNYTISNNTAGVNVFANTGKLNIINGTIISTGANVSRVGYIIKNYSGGIVNISGGTLTYNKADDSEGKVIESESGAINITGGTLSCNSKAATMNINGGTLNISGGVVKASNTYKGQAVYNNGGTTTISGDAYLENVSANNSNGRAAVHNNSGTVNILGGTIVSKASSAVKNSGTMTIGINDGTIDITSPVLQGKIYGLESASTVTVYDGIFKGQGTTSDKAISNEANISHGDTTITHDTEMIDNVQYDVAYLTDSLVRYTVTFNPLGGTTTLNTKTLLADSEIGELPVAEKEDATFIGWFTEETGGTKIDEHTLVTDDITYFAHYSAMICKRATSLHTSGNITYGQLPAGYELRAGDAFDCDVDGDGTYSASNERFYYLTGDDDTAVLIYSNNVSQGNPSCSASGVDYGLPYADGPSTAYQELPGTAWSGVSLANASRQIKDETGSVTGTFSYTGKTTRLATIQEIKAATTNTLDGTTNELNDYDFLMENVGGSCQNSYLLETPSSSGTAAYIIDGTAKKLSTSSSAAVRPVIEIPKSAIEVDDEPEEFDMIPEAMRVYFDNVSSWDAGQSDANFDSFNNSMTNNLTAKNCVYYLNDNVNSENGSVYCDQPNKYDTGVGGDVNVYEYNDKTRTASNSVASYVSVEDGKLYNMIPNKVYYWESATNSLKNGYVKPTGERRLITINGTSRMTRNVRDLGGLPVDTDNDGTIDGTIKYQKLYRGEKIWGGDNVTKAEFSKLGITNEYDLRTPNTSEIVSSEEDQLANYTNFEIVHYRIDHTEFGSPASEPRFNGKSYYQLARDAAIDVMQKVVAGNDDYALYFHCRIGADRTGTLAYILEGLLGVPTEYRYQDYELTTFFGLRERTRYYKIKTSTNDSYKFIYLKDSIRNATPNNTTGVEDVMAWFTLEGTTVDGVNLVNLVNQFKTKMIDYQ